MATKIPVDDVVAEARRLRDELLRAAARLDGFAAQLVSEVKEQAEDAEEETDGG